ncbi:hypothetical protein GF407_05565 [candidate division KSB1 bacterium]|nr:hypothetical protein [candidate division KSB1 bacterium]
MSVINGKIQINIVIFNTFNTKHTILMQILPGINGFSAIFFDNPIRLIFYRKEIVWLSANASHVSVSKKDRGAASIPFVDYYFALGR